MRRIGAALFLALALVIGPHKVSGQNVPESELWQDTDRAEALRRMIVAASQVCSRPSPPPTTMEQIPELEREFINTVRPLIRSTLTGVYGHDRPFWLEKVTHVQSLKKHPRDVLRAVVEVQTYEGAHHPLGIDTVEYQLVPGPYLYAYRVEHRKHPEARPPR